MTTIADTSLEDTFRYSTNPDLKKIWETKMVNDKKSLFADGNDAMKLILEDSRYVMFDGLDFIKFSPEYRRCEITHIKKVITVDRYYYLLRLTRYFWFSLD